MSGAAKRRYAQPRCGWTDEIIDAAKALADRGLSYEAVRRELYKRFGFGPSRAAVRGKLEREGYDLAKKPAAVLVRAVSFGRLPVAQNDDAPRPEGPSGQLVPLMARGCGCAYPTGEGSDGQALFCAEAVSPEGRGRPYCAAHLALMYAAPRKPIRLPAGEGARSRPAAPRDASFLSRWG